MPEFFNEDLYEADLKRAIEASKAEVRSLSLSPTTSGNISATLNGYSKVVSGAQARSMTPPNMNRKQLPYKQSRRGKYRYSMRFNNNPRLLYIICLDTNRNVY